MTTTMHPRIDNVFPTDWHSRARHEPARLEPLRETQSRFQRSQRLPPPPELFEIAVNNQYEPERRALALETMLEQYQDPYVTSPVVPQSPPRVDRIFLPPELPTLSISSAIEASHSQPLSETSLLFSSHPVDTTSQLSALEDIHWDFGEISPFIPAPPDDPAPLFSGAVDVNESTRSPVTPTSTAQPLPPTATGAGEDTDASTARPPFQTQDPSALTESQPAPPTTATTITTTTTTTTNNAHAPPQTTSDPAALSSSSPRTDPAASSFSPQIYPATSSSAPKPTHTKDADQVSSQKEESVTATQEGSTEHDAGAATGLSNNTTAPDPDNTATSRSSTTVLEAGQNELPRDDHTLPQQQTDLRDEAPEPETSAGSSSMIPGAQATSPPVTTSSNANLASTPQDSLQSPGPEETQTGQEDQTETHDEADKLTGEEEDGDGDPDRRVTPEPSHDQETESKTGETKRGQVDSSPSGTNVQPAPTAKDGSSENGAPLSATGQEPATLGTSEQHTDTSANERLFDSVLGTTTNPQQADTSPPLNLSDVAPPIVTGSPLAAGDQNKTDDKGIAETISSSLDDEDAVPAVDDVTKEADHQTAEGTTEQSTLSNEQANKTGAKSPKAQRRAAEKAAKAAKAARAAQAAQAAQAAREARAEAARAARAEAARAERAEREEATRAEVQRRAAEKAAKAEKAEKAAREAQAVQAARAEAARAAQVEAARAAREEATQAEAARVEARAAQAETARTEAQVASTSSQPVKPAWANVSGKEPAWTNDWKGAMSNTKEDPPELDTSVGRDIASSKPTIPISQLDSSIAEEDSASTPPQIDDAASTRVPTDKTSKPSPTVSQKPGMLRDEAPEPETSAGSAASSMIPGAQATSPPVTTSSNANLASTPQDSLRSPGPEEKQTGQKDQTETHTEADKPTGEEEGGDGGPDRGVTPEPSHDQETESKAGETKRGQVGSPEQGVGVEKLGSYEGQSGSSKALFGPPISKAEKSSPPLPLDPTISTGTASSLGSGDQDEIDDKASAEAASLGPGHQSTAPSVNSVDVGRQQGEAQSPKKKVKLSTAQRREAALAAQAKEQAARIGATQARKTSSQPVKSVWTNAGGKKYANAENGKGTERDTKGDRTELSTAAQRNDAFSNPTPPVSQPGSSNVEKEVSVLTPSHIKDATSPPSNTVVLNEAGHNGNSSASSRPPTETIPFSSFSMNLGGTENSNWQNADREGEQRVDETTLQNESPLGGTENNTWQNADREGEQREDETTLQNESPLGGTENNTWQNADRKGKQREDETTLQNEPSVDPIPSNLHTVNSPPPPPNAKSEETAVTSPTSLPDITGKSTETVQREQGGGAESVAPQHPGTSPGVQSVSSSDTLQRHGEQSGSSPIEQASHNRAFQFSQQNLSSTPTRDGRYLRSTPNTPSELNRFTPLPHTTSRRRASDVPTGMLIDLGTPLMHFHQNIPFPSLPFASQTSGSANDPNGLLQAAGSENVSHPVFNTDESFETEVSPFNGPTSLPLHSARPGSTGQEDEGEVGAQSGLSDFVPVQTFRHLREGAFDPQFQESTPSVPHVPSVQPDRPTSQPARSQLALSIVLQWMPSSARTTHAGSASPHHRQDSDGDFELVPRPQTDGEATGGVSGNLEENWENIDESNTSALSPSYEELRGRNQQLEQRNSELKAEITRLKEQLARLQVSSSDSTQT